MDQTDDRVLMVRMTALFLANAQRVASGRQTATFDVAMWAHDAEGCISGSIQVN